MEARGRFVPTALGPRLALLSLTVSGFAVRLGALPIVDGLGGFLFSTPSPALTDSMPGLGFAAGFLAEAVTGRVGGLLIRLLLGTRFARPLVRPAGVADTVFRDATLLLGEGAAVDAGCFVASADARATAVLSPGAFRFSIVAHSDWRLVTAFFGFGLLEAQLSSS